MDSAQYGLKLNEFFSFTHAHLAEAGILTRRGGVLYSELHTLAPGRFYFLGFNPGGPADDPSALTIEEDIEKLREDRLRNRYLHESWGQHDTPGDAPFQKRMRSLAFLLGVQLQNVCASNLIFCKSRKANDIAFPLYANKCWPVHERILDIVSPQYIVTIGNHEQRSAYSFLKTRFNIFDGNATSPVQTARSGHRRYTLKVFRVQYNGRLLKVIGLPHFSYYSLTAPGPQEEVRKFIADYVN